MWAVGLAFLVLAGGVVQLTVACLAGFWLDWLVQWTVGVARRAWTRWARGLDEPLPAIMAGGNHIAEVRFLMNYFTQGGGQVSSIDDPAHAVTTRDRMALGIVMLAGEPWQVVDIGMRMLTPRELARAQGFPDDYVIDPMSSKVGKHGRLMVRPLPKTDQVRLIGNSVCPQVARALVEANIGKNGQQHIWQGHQLATAGVA